MNIKLFWIALILILFTTGCMPCDTPKEEYSFYSQVENICVETTGNDGVSAMYLAQGNIPMYVIYKEHCQKYEDQTIYYKKTISYCGEMQWEQSDPITKEEYEKFK